MAASVVPLNVIPMVKPTPFANAAIETPLVISVDFIGPWRKGPMK